MGEPVPLRCAIYCRISQDRESEEKGVTRQEEDCRELAAALGFEVVRVYVDNDISASTRTKKTRPDYDAMMVAVRAGTIDVIVAYSNGRLTRRPLELEDVIKVHEQTGVMIHTVKSGNDDLSTADGRMVARIKAAVDAAEVERSAERIARAARQRREEGRLHGGARTFGYVHGSPLGYCQEIDPVAQKAIRDGMVRLFQTGKVSEVRKLWQRMGVLTPLGKEWRNDGNVARTLRNPRIAGLVAHEGQVVGEGNWPAIITRAEHEAIIEALGTRGAKKTGGPPRARKYLLPGFVYCLCGTPMSAQVYVPPEGKTGGYNRYVCISQRGGCGQCSRQRPWLDEVVLEWVAGAIEGKITASEGPADDDRNPAIEAEIRELQAEIKRVQAGQAKGIYTDDEALEEIIPRREQIQLLRAKQGELAKEAALVPIDRDQELEDWLDDDPETLHRRREILGRYVKRIIVKPVGKGGSNGWDGPPPESVVIVPRG
ncbi:recombinase family protein [Micromonospora mirobrigensis]|uniref:Site-specific DNA recombinase n=1 Tax=Micromonospora mirobrigensis TaxID=262898 RepID=A0A1C5A2T9_9ACTN|nr:recombinase family protein [Micromonospora mirobrigensis]SCF39543.1 Site-specific DNA recombinase [Micromonospora mirobrigensis]